MKLYPEADKDPTQNNLEDNKNLMIYFDAIVRGSRDIKEAELCYCIQRDGQVLSHPKPCIVKMKHA